MQTIKKFTKDLKKSTPTRTTAATFECLNASSGLYASSGLSRGGYVDDDVDSRTPPEVGGRDRSFPRWGKERPLP